MILTLVVFIIILYFQSQMTRMEELKIELETLKTKLQLSEKQLAEQNNTKSQLRHLQEELSAVRKMHHEQLETAEEAREAAELRAVEIQKQQEQRCVREYHYKSKEIFMLICLRVEKDAVDLSF